MAMENNFQGFPRVLCFCFVSWFLVKKKLIDGVVVLFSSHHLMTGASCILYLWVILYAHPTAKELNRRPWLLGSNRSNTREQRN
ncbi:hypothetical protein V8C34DRAFT_276255 [Trichoderma compactum]